MYTHFNLAFSLDRGQAEDVFPERKAWLQTSSISLVFGRTIKFSLDRIQIQFVPVCILRFKDVI